MSVSGIGSADKIQGSDANTSIQSIDQKIQELKNQMKKIRENKKLTPEEKEKRIKNLEQQIKKLEEQKKKMKKKESGNEDPLKENAANSSLDDTVGNNIDTRV